MPLKVNFQWRILHRKGLNVIQGCSADVVDCFNEAWVGMEPDNQDALLLVKDPLGIRAWQNNYCCIHAICAGQHADCSN